MGEEESQLEKAHAAYVAACKALEANKTAPEALETALAAMMAMALAVSKAKIEEVDVLDKLLKRKIK